jgi:hypothetical protein
MALDSAALDHQVHLRALATAIERVCNSNVDLRSISPTVFDAVSVPAMSVHCYLVRMHRYTKFDFVCFHVATWYLHRLAQIEPAYCPTLHNIHRLLVAALLVASKATDGALRRSPGRPAPLLLSSVQPLRLEPPRESSGASQWRSPCARCGVRADIFHANLFMAQCGGIGVSELNKLEVELCERLQWRLLPTTSDMRELLEAVHSPTSVFWDAWRNAPRTRTQLADDGSTEHEEPVRLPHAKSVQHSLSRLFAANQSGSDSNLEVLGANSSARVAAAKKAAAAPAEQEDASRTSSSSNSPRSVMLANRTFSLSNLFGLASGW